MVNDVVDVSDGVLILIMFKEAYSLFQGITYVCSSMLSHLSILFEQVRSSYSTLHTIFESQNIDFHLWNLNKSDISDYTLATHLHHKTLIAPLLEKVLRSFEDLFHSIHSYSWGFWSAVCSL